MPVAIGFDLPEEHLHFAVPRHLRKLIHCSDEQRGQAAIDFFIDDQDGNALLRRQPRTKGTSAEPISAIYERPAAASRIAFDFDVLTWMNGGAAPGAVCELCGRATASARVFI